MSEPKTDLIAAIREEIHHAAANGHRLDRDCQGVAPGERVPSVKVSSIEAVLARFEDEASAPCKARLSLREKAHLLLKGASSITRM